MQFIFSYACWKHCACSFLKINKFVTIIVFGSLKVTDVRKNQLFFNFITYILYDFLENDQRFINVAPPQGKF